MGPPGTTLVDSKLKYLANFQTLTMVSNGYMKNVEKDVNVANYFLFFKESYL